MFHVVHRQGVVPSAFSIPFNLEFKVQSIRIPVSGTAVHTVWLISLITTREEKSCSCYTKLLMHAWCLPSGPR